MEVGGECREQKPERGVSIDLPMRQGGPNTVVKQRNHFASNFRIWQRNVDRHLPQGG